MIFILLNKLIIFFFYTCHSKELYIKSKISVIIKNTINTISKNKDVKFIIFMFSAKGIKIKNSPS